MVRIRNYFRSMSMNKCILYALKGNFVASVVAIEAESTSILEQNKQRKQMKVWAKVSSSLANSSFGFIEL